MKGKRLHLEWDHLSRHKGLFAAALLSRGVWEIVPMQVPLLAGVVVDGLSGKGLRLAIWPAPEMSPANILAFAALGLLLVALLHSACAYFYTMAGSALDKHFVTGLRKAVLEKTILLSLDQHRQFGQGELLDRSLRHTDRLRGFTERVFTRSITNAFRAVYPVAMLFAISPSLACMALAIVPPQWWVTWWLQKRLHKATQQSLASHADLTAEIHEHLDGVETLEALEAQAPSVNKLHKAAEAVEADELATDRITALIRAATWFFTGLGIALVWWLGGNRVLEGAMTLGSLVAFTGFTEFAYRPMRLFSSIVKTYRTGLVSLERVQELLETEPAIQDQPEAKRSESARGPILFQDVSFAYGPATVLDKISLAIEAGKLTAIVGPNGSGKSTLLRLLTRILEPSHGTITVGDVPLTNITRASLHRRIAFLPQRAVLFSGTILENLRLAKPEASLQEIQAACQAAEASEIIERLGQGYDTRIGRGGALLSTGEVQRLVLARALLCEPDVLLLDEPTASIDPVSEAAIVRSLMNLRGRMTLILVGHRPRTVRGADRIFVIRDGSIEALGVHDELLMQSAFYRELCHSGEDRDTAYAG